MAFRNRIRLPINISQPQFGSARQQYVRADGTTKNLSTVLKKTYKGQTDWIPEKWHERLVVALSHDDVVIEGEKYLGGVALDGEYVIDWDEIFRTAVAGAKFQVTVTPFNNANSNCITCDQAGQVSLTDDSIGSVDEDSNQEINVIGNDDVCCSPVEFSITSFNSDYVDSVSIDTSGTVSFHVKTGLVAANGIKIITYRATCANGGYDEADIFADINGTVPGCLAPTGLIVSGVTNTSIHAEWTAPSPAPDHYHWEVVTSPGGVVVASGDESGLSVDISTGMSADTAYRFRVASECDPTNGVDESNFVEQEFTTTPVAANACGYYRVFPAAGPINGTITYMGCGGFFQSIAASILTPVNICALQSSDGVYIDIDSDFTGITITWLNNFQCGGT